MQGTRNCASHLPLGTFNELEVKLSELWPATWTEGEKHSGEIKSAEVNDVVLAG